MTKNMKTVGIAAIAAIMMVSLFAYGLNTVTAAPANKTLIGSAAHVSIQADDEWATIASGSIKTSAPSDLRITHQQECAIHTGLNLDVDSQDVTSAIRQDVRVLLDGEPVDIAGYDDGIVTMCGRAYHIDTNILEQIDALCGYVESLNATDTIEECIEDPVFNSFIATKATHGWDWMALDVGPGEHTIQVQNKLVLELDDITGKGKKTTNDSNADTYLQVGKRNLLVSEEKLANTQ